MKSLLKKSLSATLLVLLLGICFIRCDNKLDLESVTIIDKPIVEDPPIILSPMSIPVYNFNWETVNWMPTPPGQSPISPPWIGQGCLSPIYGLDIINDRKASDGWTLLYSTFDPNATGPLSNPYFVLYNKYRGLMRIYLYLTTPFVAPSTFLQDGISISSNYSTSMLNFLGQEIVDASTNQKMYSQIQPDQSDGMPPLAANKWYMLQYEIAYDPNLSQIQYNNIQLYWYISYCNVKTVNLGGNVDGEMKAILGSSSSSSSNSTFISELVQTGKTAGTGVVAGVGKTMLDNAKVGDDGSNKLGLPKGVFQSLLSGIGSAISSAGSSIAGNLLNLILGGSSGSSTPPVNYSINATMNLSGSITSSGSFPSSPTSFWVPGTQNLSSAQGYVPLYNKVLGVVNFSGKPSIAITKYENTWMDFDPKFGHDLLPFGQWSVTFHMQDYSNNLKINPEILNIANVTIERQDLIAFTGGGTLLNPTFIWVEMVEGNLGYGTSINDTEVYDAAVRFTIKVTPKDGSPSSTIIKTFKLNIIYN